MLPHNLAKTGCESSLDALQDHQPETSKTTARHHQRSSHTHTHIHTGKRKREGKSTPGGQGVTITGTGRTIHSDITNTNKMFK